MGKGRAPCCDKSKVKKGPWSPAEDLRLTAFIHNHGHGNWRSLPQRSGLLRCGKSCRLRWINYLRPDVKRGPLSPEEELQIINLHSSMGNKWSKIASHFPGRTDNEIKNVWNTHLKKKAKLNLANSPSSPSSNSCISNALKNDEPLQMFTDEIPLESDIVDLWEFSDKDMIFDDSIPTESNITASPISHEKGDENLDLSNWLMYLENELELMETPTVADQTSTQNEMTTQDDQTNHDENDLISYFPMLHSLPNDFDF